MNPWLLIIPGWIFGWIIAGTIAWRFGGPRTGIEPFEQDNDRGYP